jgi:hypothetical protein
MMPWFRLYVDVLNDKKLGRVARLLNISYIHALGYWTAILCLANDSPTRGTLLYSETEPLRYEDVAETFHVTPDETKLIIDAFLSAELLVPSESKGGSPWSVAGWSKRQYQSDSSTERVRKHRQKKQSGTFQEQGGNAPDTDTEGETEAEGDQPLSSSSDAHSPEESDLLHPIYKTDFGRAYIDLYYNGNPRIPSGEFANSWNAVQAIEAHQDYEMSIGSYDKCLAALVKWKETHPKLGRKPLSYILCWVTDEMEKGAKKAREFAQ